MTVIVKDMRDLSEYIYTCSPRKAVIACYAQNEHSDYNTGQYEERYGELVEESEYHYFVGDYAVRKDENEQSQN